MSNQPDIESHPNIEGLTLFNADPGPHEHAVHAHDAYSIISLTEGQKHFHHCGQTYIVKAGEIAIANPNELHGCGPVDMMPWAHLTWYVSEELACELTETMFRGTSALKLATPKISDPELSAQLNAAHIESREGDLFDRQSIALSALCQLFEKYGDSSGLLPVEDTVSHAKRRMHKYEQLLSERIKSGLNLQDLADIGSISIAQVIRDFKKIHHLTPSLYFRHLRLTHAKDLIISGCPLSEVASASGFSDQSHMTRAFRETYGISPKKILSVGRKSDGSAVL